MYIYVCAHVRVYKHKHPLTHTFTNSPFLTRELYLYAHGLYNFEL